MVADPGGTTRLADQQPELVWELVAVLEETPAGGKSSQTDRTRTCPVVPGRFGPEPFRCRSRVRRAVLNPLTGEGRMPFAYNSLAAVVVLAVALADASARAQDEGLFGGQDGDGPGMLARAIRAGDKD
jgi:hypothetical protein